MVEGEINAELFETVLSRTRRRGPARLRLAAMAALAEPDAVVRGLSSEELSAAAGMADRTYRRARQELLGSGELELLSGAAGRGNTNVWQVRASVDAAIGGATVSPARRVVPPAGARPLLATVGSSAAGNRPVLTGVPVGKGGQDRTVPEPNCPAWSGVSAAKGGQDRTLLDLPAAETPAETPAETRAANARGGRNDLNPRIPEDPPSPPPGGGRPDSIIVEQTYTSERGRRRRRQVRVDLAEVRRSLGLPGPDDRADWEQIRSLLLGAVGEDMFAIWLEPLELIAIGDDRALIVTAPPATRSWVSDRYGRLLSARAERVGRELRFADEPERAALGNHQERPSGSGRGGRQQATGGVVT